MALYHSITRWLPLAALTAGLLASSAALASACPAHYVDGRLPEFRNPKLAAATTELCYGVFGVMHSGITLTPLWSAEHLTSENIAGAQQLGRKNTFHSEQRLPAGQRAELADYARSGFDRGHMAPSDDMPDSSTQRDSFSLANMVPQDSENNRHVWAAIEGAVRKLAQQEGDLYVITGPAFIGGKLQKVGKVLVPSHLYKLVYSPRQRAGAAFFIENNASADYEILSIAALEQRVGLNLLPSLTDQQKQVTLRLPKVKQRPPKP